MLYTTEFEKISLTTFFHPSVIHRGLTASELAWMKSWCREHSLGTTGLNEADQVMLHILWHRTDHEGRSFMTDRHIQRFLDAVENNARGWECLSGTVREMLQQIGSRDRPYLNGAQILAIRMAALDVQSE